jgi:hypothetical protein
MREYRNEVDAVRARNDALEDDLAEARAELRDAQKQLEERADATPAPQREKSPLRRAAELYGLGAAVMALMVACGLLGYLSAYAWTAVIPASLIAIAGTVKLYGRCDSAWMLIPAVAGLIMCVNTSLAFNDLAAIRNQGQIPKVAVEELGSQTAEVVRVRRAVAGPHHGLHSYRCGTKKQDNCRTEVRSVVAGPVPTGEEPSTTTVPAWLVDPRRRAGKPLDYLRRQKNTRHARAAIRRACRAPSCQTAVDAPLFKAISAPGQTWANAHVELVALFFFALWSLVVLALGTKE